MKFNVSCVINNFLKVFGYGIELGMILLGKITLKCSNDFALFVSDKGPYNDADGKYDLSEQFFRR